MYWAPVNIDREDPDIFWIRHAFDPPTPLSGIDLREYTPWWKTYTDPENGVLAEQVQPEAKLDPTVLFNHDLGATQTANDAKKDFALTRQKINSENRKKRDWKWDDQDCRWTWHGKGPAPERVFTGPSNVPAESTVLDADTLDSNAAAPAVKISSPLNIYLRPVEPKDTTQLLEMYNYWVNHSLAPVELDSLGQAAMDQKVNAIFQARLPFIVAVLRFKRAKQTACSAMFASETIVGYASLSGKKLLRTDSLKHFAAH